MAATAALPSRPLENPQTSSVFCRFSARIMPCISSYYFCMPDIFALARTCKLQRRQIMHHDTLWRDVAERDLYSVLFRLPADTALISLPTEASTLALAITHDLNARNSSSFNWTAIRNHLKFRRDILALINYVPMPFGDTFPELPFLQQSDFYRFLHSIARAVEGHASSPQITLLIRECLHWTALQKILSRLASRFLFQPPSSEVIKQVISQIANVVDLASGIIENRLRCEILRRFPDVPSLLNREHQRRIQRVRETEGELAFLIPNQAQEEPSSIRVFGASSTAPTGQASQGKTPERQDCSIM